MPDKVMDARAAAALDEIRSGLARARERWRLVEIAEGLLFWMAVLAGVILVTATVEVLLRPGLIVRLVLFATLMGTAAAALVRGFAMPLLRTFRDEAVARRVERAMPALGNALINALELASDDRVPSRALAEAAVIQSRDRAREVKVEKAISTERARVLARWAAGAAAALALSFGLFGGPLWSAFQQVMLPWEFVPVKGAVKILSVKPGDATVRAGAQVRVEVEIAPVEGRPPEGRFYYRLAGESEIEKRMTRIDRRRYAFVISAAGETRYRVEVGRTQSRMYRLTVIERPALERVDIELRYPDYTGRDAEKIERAVDEKLDIRAPVGTTVGFTVTANRPVKSAFLEIAGAGGTERVSLETVAQTTGRRTLARGSVHLSRPGERRYAIRLADETGTPDETPVWHVLASLPDDPPKVRFLAPARKLELAPGAKVALVVRATDDFGLTHVAIRFRRNKEGEARMLRAWAGEELAGRADTALTHAWRLERSSFGVGDIVTYWAVAKDRMTDREGSSSRWEIRLVDPAKKAKAKVSALASLLKALEKIAALQESARERARKVAARRKARPASAWKPTVGSQTSVRERTLAAVEASASAGADKDVAIIRAVLKRLATGEMARAIVLAERLAGGSPEASAKGLDASQTMILDRLRRLLGLLPRAIEEAKKEELPDEEGSDLPDDVAKKLKDLAEQLKEFMEEQRKVISSTEDLAKIPVEEFTEDDKAKQEALAAIEEKWEKFMKEAHSDLSKLPTQDFSTEQLLSELVETFSEVEMAKDALTKKSAEIAVPVEQAGLEAAEELTTHLEKWLPDEPDRAKWSMEEPLGEFETPMTELPSELEDIVGELMEGEEDIFDEMEDVSSSWADSLDKGAGWDAMDGPISNMSAQGVTGNTLPNSSEIGGRSGEGRTGKASGEMVEDSATGKGGRKTPTRLSPDAFMGGEINDTSKDPPGGATGGGKLSGAGGEGLEGPVPPELDREMQRLKGAQASLRNKAERIGMLLKARNFPEADIELTLAHLRSLEADLKDGRYSNIARRRNVILSGLGRSREFVEGTARVELDRSRGPEGFDEEVGSAKDEVDPAGYEDLLRAYREAIRSGKP